MKISTSIYIACLLTFMGGAWCSKPMESLPNYNVIIVHGAAVKEGGMDCVVDSYPEAYSYGRDPVTGYLNRTGGIGGHSSATGMIKSLGPWLSETLFDGDKSAFYLQRPFTNPATSPKLNGKEIGDRTWNGGGHKCTERRALIEEAQEVRVGGRKYLDSIRQLPAVYRSQASRNILISHSMGGLASREYVQGEDYNDDVDKVITLDSPHEGTPVLNQLISAQSFGLETGVNALQDGMVAMVHAIALLALGVPVADEIGLKEMMLSGYLTIGGDAAQDEIKRWMSVAFAAMGYNYSETDGVYSYIDPDSHSLEVLNGKGYKEGQPAFRVLASEGGLAFGNSTDENLFFAKFFFPDAIASAIYNAASQAKHTDLPTKPYWTNLFVAPQIGMLGINLSEQGSALIPHWSGIADDVSALNSPQADVLRRKFQAYPNVEAKADVEALLSSYTALLGYLATISYFWPDKTSGLGAKIGVCALFMPFYAAVARQLMIPAFEDLPISHRMPLMDEYQSQWKGPPSTYSTVNGSSTTVTPYLMEDFLYEKPFVTLRVTNANDWLEETDAGYSKDNYDSLGLLNGNDTSLAILAPNISLATKLEFKSTSDWEKVGLKKDTWKRVPGVDGTVPIRRVDRYAFPGGIAVTDFIHRYRFVVDDLMPHRLRQVRMNFNFREDVAWECDVAKDPEADDNCQVYMRHSDGKGWQFLKKEKHPVLKDGTFDFEPARYFGSLGDIQKDNQNTVTITTVNKIGLSNTQRFNYLFKATADLVQQAWPVYGTAVSAIKDFSLYASTLDYQGFQVYSGADQFTRENENVDTAAYVAMALTPASDGARLNSQLVGPVGEGKYLWHYQLAMGNSTDTSVWEETIPFQLDQTPPRISIAAEKAVINPDSSVFLARFSNDTSVDASLRLLRLRLERQIGNTRFWDLPLLNTIISPEFAIGWDGIDKSQLTDGRYRITAQALDGAAPNRAVYNTINDVVAGTRPWSDLKGSGDAWSVLERLNSDTAFAEFVIDKTAPQARFTELKTVDVVRDKPLRAAPVVSGSLLLNEDQLLRMDYAVSDAMLGRDSAPVALSWRFVNMLDTSVAHQLGDSLWLTGSGADSASWTENQQMQIPEGDYRIVMRAQDAAGNLSTMPSATTLHIDRTAPTIKELVSSKLVYGEDTDYQATLYMAQRDAIEKNRSDLQCYYRVTGPDKESGWTNIGAETRSRSKMGDTVLLVFSVAKDSVGATKGKRYLEAGCLDSVGNFASSVDVFHVGELSPTIVTPQATESYDLSVLSITGLAPVPSSYVEGEAGYRLQWRPDSSTQWSTVGIDVGAGRRLSSAQPWLSNEAQPVEGDLGTWDRSGLDAGVYWLRLSTRACNACGWVSDSVAVNLSTLVPDASTARLAISAPAVLTAGEASTALSVRVDGVSGNSHRARLYAQDAEGQSLFEVSTDSIRTSPFEGTPAHAGAVDGVWFWSENGQYHLQWKGVPSGKSLSVNYHGAAIESACLDNSGKSLAGCAVKDSALAGIPSNIGSLVQSSAELAIFGIPEGLDRAMVLTASAGHLVFQDSTAFRVDLTSLKGNNSLILPVYLGASSAPGYTVQTLDMLDLHAAFQVVPSFYSLHTFWDGLSSTGGYPASGKAMLYAEAVENDALDKGLVLRDSAEILLKLPNLQIVSSEASPLTNFYVLENDAENMKLRNKVFTFGIWGRDALVSAYVKDPQGNVLVTLLDNVEVHAAISATARKIIWDGMVNDHVVTTPGTYSFVIEAKENDGTQTASRAFTFELSVAPGVVLVNDDVGGTDAVQSALNVAEAVDDVVYPGQQRYIPTPDFLVTAQASGLTLPDSLRTIRLQHTVAGTQVAQGYAPERYSLAVKRQRDSLDLVIVSELEMQLEGVDCDNGHLSHETKKTYAIHPVKYMKPYAAEVFNIQFDADSVGASGRGIYGEAYSHLNLYAYMLKDTVGKTAEELIASGWDVWKQSYELPLVSDQVVSDTGYKFHMHKSNDLGCVPVAPKDGESGHSCQYLIGADGHPVATANYDPSVNMVDLMLHPKENNHFYSKKDYVNNRCHGLGEYGNKRYEKINFDVLLAISKEYWNADFGYDNLVNRTIRFDQTNITMYGENGYLQSLQNNVTDASVKKDSLYYDGSKWQANTTYGLLTPFETHRFPFVGVKAMASNNAFVFADEDVDHIYPSYYHAKFYGLGGGTSRNFIANISGKTKDGTAQAVQVKNDGEITKTSLLQHGSVDVSVSMLAKPSEYAKDTMHIAYPAQADWVPSAGDFTGRVCPDFTDAKWLQQAKSSTLCAKYYQAGSHVHHYYGDYDSLAWAGKMLNTDGTLRNPLNASALTDVNNVVTAFNLDRSRFGSSTVGNTLTVALDSAQYDYTGNNFYLDAQDIALPSQTLSGQDVNSTPLVLHVDADAYAWDKAKKRLLFPAQTWSDPALVDNQIVYRYTLDTSSKALPLVDVPLTRSMAQLYAAQQGIQQKFDPKNSLFGYSTGAKSWQRNNWIKNLALSSPSLTQLDGKPHTHYTARKVDNSQSQSVALERRAVPTAIRPAELIAVQGRASLVNMAYQLSYVNNKEFHTLKDSIMGDTEDSLRLLSWFDVNRLQGNTSLMLTWGGTGGQNLFMRQLDLNIGSTLQNKTGVVTSLLGEVSVAFPANTAKDSVITVRTVDPKDYAFTTFNNATLRGPVVEVLPSMQFTGPDYPRVKARISRSELEAANLAPSRVRLYKVDFAKGKFVPLENTLYGFLKADGTPAVAGNSSNEVKMCASAEVNTACYSKDWRYLLVSAETHTFSVFVALDSLTITQNPITFAVNPAIGVSTTRTVQVSGTENFRIYVDDDSLWNDDGDVSAPVRMDVVVSAAGTKQVTLPERLNSWLYLVPMHDATELAVAPTRVAVQVVPVEMACNVSAGPLWLGLDNGYMEMAQSCNQYGMGTLQLRKNGSLVAQASKSLPDTLRWNGRTGLKQIAHGNYTSRYWAVGLVGAESQILGPEIYTDSQRPMLSTWNVQDSSVLLDHVFHVGARLNDDLSGLGVVRLVWSLGSVPLDTVDVQTDSTGKLSYNVLVTRSQISQCQGCVLSVSLHAEDLGHNYADTSWQSGRLWPYPVGLALWYPALEGAGSTSYEMTGTGHDLALSMDKPWLSASGLYFFRSADKALGQGSVDLDSVMTYTLEAWVRPGYVTGTQWRRLLGFDAVDGRSIELLVKGQDVRLDDGSNSWTATGILEQAKVWTHVVAVVDSHTVSFYSDGELKASLPTAIRKYALRGRFSLGASSATSAFVGHVEQVRLYNRALRTEEIQAVFHNIGLGDSSGAVIALASSLQGDENMERGFSCGVPGSNFWTATGSQGFLTWNSWINKAATYRVFLYARSTVAGPRSLAIGADGTSLVNGSVTLETVWRPVELEGVSLTLATGYSSLMLRMPEGVEIAGVALSNDLQTLASRITWKATENTVVAGNMSAQVRFEGYPEASMLRPRIRLTNTGSTTIEGFKVRYYFRGEDPAQVQAAAFYPQDSGLTVGQDAENLGYAQWNFPSVLVAPGQSPFWGEGPHFGLYNTGFTLWVATDDPSFVENAASAYMAAPGLVVLDSANRVLTGSCFEDETPVITSPVVRVLARDVQAGDATASHLYVQLENIGKVPLKNYELRYSFYVPGSVEPELDVYDMQGLEASRVNLGNGKWQIAIKGSASIGPGIAWANPAQFALHLPGWSSGWSVADDPSYMAFTTEWIVATGIEVFDSTGNRIYGKAPAWPSADTSSTVALATARVMAKENKPNESNGSSVRLYVENTGTQALSDFEVRYWFTTAQGKALDYAVYNNSRATVSKVQEAENFYSIRFKYMGVTLASGEKTEWGDGLELFVHHADWSVWNKDDDYSHANMGTTFGEARYVALYDGNGKLVWGAEPQVPSDNSNENIEVARTSDGLVLSLKESATLRLDLVDAAGLPQLFVFQGTLGIGEHSIAVDWSLVDLAKTYLVVRLNGQVVSTQLLSNLGN